MKKFTIIALLLTIQIICSFLNVGNAQATCPPEELPEVFSQIIPYDDFLIAAVNEAEPHYIEHIKYVYNRLLVRDGKVDGRIRKAVRDEKMTILVLEDRDDLAEFEQSFGNKKYMGNCTNHIIILEEIHYIGSEGDKHDLRDGTLGELSEIVLYYGVRKAYPGWTRRLKKAMSRAISAGTFNPYKGDDELERKYWHYLYAMIGMQVYYNLWSKDTTVMDGAFGFTTREALAEGDPNLFKLLEEIFPTNLYQ